MPRREKQSFWTTLPGVLTAIAALITAIAGVAGVATSKPNETRTRAAWTKEVNPHCTRLAAALLDGQRPVDAAAALLERRGSMGETVTPGDVEQVRSAFTSYIATMVRAVGDFQSQVGEIVPADGDSGRVKDMLRALDEETKMATQVADHTVKALGAHTRGDTDTANIENSEANRLNPSVVAKGEEFNGIARDLGARQCSIGRWVPA